ncbi:hypothetical protein GCM10027082_27000 [Comamonas humi]
MKPTLRLLCAAAAATLLAACTTAERPRPLAEATLKPTAGSTASGSLQIFPAEGDAVRVVVQVQGLAPGSEHGFHIHEKGDCSAPDGMSAGGHYNPTSHQHGKAGPMSHVGDLPSLVADASGVAKLSWETRTLSVKPGQPTDVKGRGVIVHKDKDDYTTQPTGNSGARLACGVIG